MQGLVQVKSKWQKLSIAFWHVFDSVGTDLTATRKCTPPFNSNSVLIKPFWGTAGG
jgi:hypothetical protein